MAAPTSASFRKYVESSGVSDLLGKALAQLFERHESHKEPENAVEFVRSLLAGDGAAAAGAESKLAQENAALKKEVQSLSESLAKLIEEREKRRRVEETEQQEKEHAARREAAERQEAEARQEAHARQEAQAREAGREEARRVSAPAEQHAVAVQAAPEFAAWAGAAPGEAAADSADTAEDS